MKNDIVFNYLKSNNIEYYKNASIEPYLTIGIGGKVNSIIIIKQKQELVNLLKIFEDANKYYIILGGGSNVVFSDFSPELFVIINKIDDIELIGNNKIKVSTGVTNKVLLDWCKTNGFCGLEFLAGIPGTIGGAAAVNAGAYGRSMSDIVIDSEVYYSNEGVQFIDNSGFKFEYRNSVFKYGINVILDLQLAVKKCSKKRISSLIHDILNKRGTAHSIYKMKTAGCFFKNPIIDGKKISAGKIIEQSGLKGEKFSNITVSDFHSNFIINTNNANFKDVLNIEKSIINKTYEATGIKLEREVIYVLSTGEKI